MWKVYIYVYGKVYIYGKVYNVYYTYMKSAHIYRYMEKCTYMKCENCTYMEI